MASKVESGVKVFTWQDSILSKRKHPSRPTTLKHSRNRRRQKGRGLGAMKPDQRTSDTEGMFFPLQGVGSLERHLGRGVTHLGPALRRVSGRSG